MTKYILNSGGIKNQPELKKQFHQELVKSAGTTPRFLLCNFAQGREYWETKFQDYTTGHVIGDNAPTALPCCP